MQVMSSFGPELQEHTKLIVLDTIMYLVKWTGCKILITSQETEDSDPITVLDDILYTDDVTVKEIIDVDIDEVAADVTFVVRKEITTQTNTNNVHPVYGITTLYDITVEEDLLSESSGSGSV